MKFFCTGECEVNLLETTDDRAERGRYSIEYKGGFLERVLYVSIRQLTKRDSGQYWCGLGGFFKDSYHEFNITVTDGEFLSHENILSYLWRSEEN